MTAAIPSKRFAIHGKNVFLPEGPSEATLMIQDGKILHVTKGSIFDPEIEIIDAGDNVVMPGVIDIHVHINEPGRTEWEGFSTATRAAAAGGITSLVEMPLNASPVTTTPEALKLKVNAAEGKLYVNCGFWGGVIPSNSHDLSSLLSSGVWGVKAFMTHSGIDEFPNVTYEDLKVAMPQLEARGLPLLAHAELDSENPDAVLLEQHPGSYQAYVKSRPRSWEDKAIDQLIELCRMTRCRTHIVHLSSSESLQNIKEARSEGLPLTVETCPQYLFFAAEDIPDNDTRYKCAPPIRERDNNEKLWEALRQGLIDFVVSDHSPATPDLKQIDSGNLKAAWGGIAGVQFSMQAVWTAARSRGFAPYDIYRWMSKNIADFMGWKARKGYFQEGADADIVIWNPEESYTVTEDMILHRHKITPYQGCTLFGKVYATYVNGIKVDVTGASAPSGELLLLKN